MTWGLSGDNLKTSRLGVVGEARNQSAQQINKTFPSQRARKLKSHKTRRKLILRKITSTITANR
jgi:hypothetical protein